MTTLYGRAQIMMFLGAALLISSCSPCTRIPDGLAFATFGKPIEASKPFNILRASVYLPSRTQGDIRVEEDNYDACQGHTNGFIEVPYVFTGGVTSLEAEFGQSIDAGFQWNCGFDTWALFFNASGHANPIIQTSGAMRLKAGTTALLEFAILPGSGDIQVSATGQWFDQGEDPQALNPVLETRTLTCPKWDCALSWDAPGYQFKVEFTLAQANREPGQSTTKERRTRSGARYRNVVLRDLELGVLTEEGHVTQQTVWPLHGNSGHTAFHGAQCMIPFHRDGLVIEGSSATPEGLRVSIDLNRE